MWNRGSGWAAVPSCAALGEQLLLQPPAASKRILRATRRLKACCPGCSLMARQQLWKDMKLQRNFCFGHGQQLQLQLLPVQQLTSLRALSLTSMSVKFVRSTADLEDITAQLPPELSALTRLGLDACDEQLDALPAYTHLRHLVYSDFEDQPLPVLLSLASALPSLQHLTKLQLHGSSTSDSVLSGLQHLSCLLELRLWATSCSAAGLAGAPRSLTKLVVEDDHMSPPKFAANTSTTSWLTALTALQHLELLCSPSENDDDDVAATPADVAALTSSSQLTYLDVSKGLVAADSYAHLSPDGRQLPLLRVLRATMGFLGDQDDAPTGIEACVSCCPNLEVLDLGMHIAGEPSGFVTGGGVVWRHHTVACVRHLHSITRLYLQLECESWGSVEWCSLAKVTTLRHLSLGYMPRDITMAVGMVELTSCRHLTQLYTESVCGEEDEESFEISVKSEAGAGRPPDVWCRIPDALLESFEVIYSTDSEASLEQKAACLSSLAAAQSQVAAELQQETNEQLRQQLAAMEETMAAQQQEHEQQQMQLQQEVAGVRAVVQAQQQEAAGLRAALQAQQQQHEQQQQLQQQELAELKAALRTQQHMHQQQQQELAAMKASLAALAAQQLLPQQEQQ